MTLINIKQLQDDYNELRAEVIATYGRNKELEAMNEFLRARIVVAEQQHKNALALLGKQGIIK